MATITAARSDIFPVGTSVGAYVTGSKQDGGAPGSAAIASATVAADGSLSITNGGISSLTPYVLYALVGGENRYLRVRSTLDVEDRGTAAGTADTTSGSPNLANVTASSGAFAQGQRISGTGIPAGTRLISGSGGSWVMSTAATANGTGVAVQAEGARVAAAGLGSATVPQTIATTWQSVVLQRRVAAGTS
jgi:hypothetical protein